LLLGFVEDGWSAPSGKPRRTPVARFAGGPGLPPRLAVQPSRLQVATRLPVPSSAAVRLITYGTPKFSHLCSSAREYCTRTGLATACERKAASSAASSAPFRP
jgi:hypothetical protein